MGLDGKCHDIWSSKYTSRNTTQDTQKQILPTSLHRSAYRLILSLPGAAEAALLLLFFFLYLRIHGCTAT